MFVIRLFPCLLKEITLPTQKIFRDPHYRLAPLHILRHGARFPQSGVLRLLLGSSYASSNQGVCSELVNAFSYQLLTIIPLAGKRYAHKAFQCWASWILAIFSKSTLTVLTKNSGSYATLWLTRHHVKWENIFSVLWGLPLINLCAFFQEKKVRMARKRYNEKQWLAFSRCCTLVKAQLPIIVLKTQ